MTGLDRLLREVHAGNPRSVARAITLVEDGLEQGTAILASLDRQRLARALVVGITGPVGAGKSTLTGRLVRFFLDQGERLGIVAVDPSSPFSGGALLGDRVRMMTQATDDRVLIRSMATRGRLGGLCTAAGAAVRIMAAAGYRLILVETVGVGQSEWDVARLADITLVVLAPGFGDDIQAMKAGLLEVADLLVINKADLPGARKLLLELQGMAEKDVLETSAVRDEGIGRLGQRILELEQELRRTNRLEEGRRQARESEALDWLLERLREPLARLVREEGAAGCDPRITAERLLERIGALG